MQLERPALTRSLRLPLDALRASIELLGEGFGDRDPRRLVVEGALGAVQRLERRVEELMDYSAPAAPSPERCSIDEVLYATQSQLAPHERRRVLLARTGGAESMVVDGALLAGALSRVLLTAIDSDTHDVLLFARTQSQDVCFRVLDPNPGRARRAGAPFMGTEPEVRRLRWELAARSVAALGGELKAVDSSEDTTLVEARVPHGLTAGVAA